MFLSAARALTPLERPALRFAVGRGAPSTRAVVLAIIMSAKGAKLPEKKKRPTVRVVFRVSVKH